MTFDHDLALADNEVLEGFHMMEEALAEYQPLSMFDECFTEAFGSGKKKEEKQKELDAKAAQLKEQATKNAKAEEKSVSGLRKVIEGLLTMCRKLIQNIEDFIEEKRLNKEEKEAFEKFKAVCKADPSLANKKITVQDYREVYKKYKELMDECEKEIEACKKDSNHSTDRIIKKCQDFVKNNIKGVAISIAASSAVNVASTNKDLAKLMRTILHSDEEVMENVRKQMGDAQFKSFDKDLRSLGHRFKWLSIKRIKMYVTSSLYSDYKSALLGPVNGVKNILSGIKNNKVDLKYAGDQARLAKNLMKNKDTRKTLGTLGSVGVNVGSITGQGFIGGIKDKVGYMGRKIIRPKTTSRQGIYGNNAVGSAYNNIKNSKDPTGPHGLKDLHLGDKAKSAGRAVKSGFKTTKDFVTGGGKKS